MSFQTPRAKKKQKFLKVSEIDFKIMLLENRGPDLSVKEIERLMSLKEQKALQERLGVNTKKTASVPTDWLGESHPDHQGSKINSKGEAKQGYSNAFLQFRSEKKSLLTNTDPSAKLDLDQVREEWKNLDDAAKVPYKKKAEEEKLLLGLNLRRNLNGRSLLSEEDKKKAKLEADRKYRQKCKMTKTIALDEGKQCTEKFREILDEKKQHMCEEVKVNENLKKSMGKTKLENSLTAEMLKDKEAALDKLKEKYRCLHRMHKTCSVFKQ